MTTATSNVPEIYGQISRVMADIGTVAKEGKNEQQGYKFRGIDQFINAAHPALVKHGVFCCPTVLEQTLETYEGVNSSGKPNRTFRVILRVEHRFFARDGSSVAVVTCGEGLDTSDKAANKAMSASQKYALIQLLMIPTADMAEADKDSPEAEGKLIPSGQPKTYTRPTAPPPALPEQESIFLRSDQQDHLRLKFKESLPVEYQAHSDQIRRDFLAKEGYAGEDGVGTSKLIPQAEFKKLLKAALLHARQYATTVPF